MKRRVISAALALCMMLTLLSGTALAAGQHPFTDVPQSHWANEAGGYVYENDLMNGVSATMFQPGGSLTRAMFVTILGRMAGAEEESGESGFADVPAGRWYSAYVAWAAGEGIVDGTGNGCFSPNSPVTREQMATMIARYVDSADLPLPETGDPAAPFTDRNAVSDWAEAGGELMRQTAIPCLSPPLPTAMRTAPSSPSAPPTGRRPRRFLCGWSKPSMRAPNLRRKQP